MIRRRDPGNFGASPYVMQVVRIPERTRFSFLDLDQIAGPLIISAFLFFALLANFIIRGALQYTSDDGPLIIPDHF
jgi:hypothetical protein